MIYSEQCLILWENYNEAAYNLYLSYLIIVIIVNYVLQYLTTPPPSNTLDTRYSEIFALVTKNLPNSHTLFSLNLISHSKAYSLLLKKLLNFTAKEVATLLSILPRILPIISLHNSADLCKNCLYITQQNFLQFARLMRNKNMTCTVLQKCKKTN